MICPYCKVDDDKVVDTRVTDFGRTIRRRRFCNSCGRRFTTYEKISEDMGLSVIKKDNTRVPYDREKIISGLEKACYKRPISASQVRLLADKVEEDIFQHSDKEVSSMFIGECVMDHLKDIDKVAYIRFASVYREFDDVSDFIDEASLTGTKITDGTEMPMKDKEQNANGTGNDSGQDCPAQ